jgi:hypothetical protein
MEGASRKYTDLVLSSFIDAGGNPGDRTGLRTEAANYDFVVNTNLLIFAAQKIISSSLRQIP